MAVDHDDPVPAVRGEALDGLADVVAEGILTDPERAREVTVFRGDADVNRGCDDDLAVEPADASVGDGFGREHVRSEGGVGAVLFGASHRQNREVGVGAVGVRPGVLREVHARPYRGGGLIAGGRPTPVRRPV